MAIIKRIKYKISLVAEYLIIIKMKLLKKKILQAKEMLYLNGRNHHRSCLDPEELEETFTEPVLVLKGSSITMNKKGCYNPNLSRNITSIFFKAICNFMISGPSLPYLQPALLKENVQFDEFYDFVNQVKIERSRLIDFISALKPHMNDSDKILACKRTMKLMTIVFVKYFSLGWIFQEQEGFKMPFLKMRFKLLKRIRNVNEI